jgi:hypothetical protein
VLDDIDKEAERGESIFADDERTEANTMLTNDLGSSLRPGERISVDGWLDAEMLTVELEIADPKREEVHRFEAGYELDDNAKMTIVEARPFLVEFLHAAATDYLRDERWPRPHLPWKGYDFRGTELFMRGSVMNEHLEAMADEWLAKAEQGQD